jgi:hypothetical protein
MPIILRPQGTVKSRVGSHASLVGTGDFSMCCWVYLDSRFCATAALFAQVGHNSAANDAGAWLQTQAFSGSTFSYEFGRTPMTGTGLYSGPFAQPFDRWLFVGVSHAGQTTDALPTYYTHTAGVSAPGALASSSGGIFFPPAGVATAGSTTGWALGSAIAGGFGGMVAHLQAWQRILSLAEFQHAMMRPGSVRTGQTLWVPCDRGAQERIGGFGGSAAGAARRWFP